MNFNFSKNEEDSKSITASGQGSFEDVLKSRDEMLPEFAKAVEKIFDNYSGEMTAVFRINEDENGNPDQSLTFVGGVGGIESTIKLIEALEEVTEKLKAHVGIQVLKNKLGDDKGRFSDAMKEVRRELRRK